MLHGDATSVARPEGDPGADARDATVIDATGPEASAVTAERREIALPDGRRLAFAEYGAPLGTPVMIFPGTPGSHLLASVATKAALARDVRIIAPDRPGIGRSDELPGRSLADWPADVALLADALGCERFAVVGISGGGPYALACAAALPERVTTAGIVSSPAPFDVPGIFAGMPLPLRAGWALLRRAPRACALALRPAGAVTTRFPLRALAMFRAIGSASDRVVLDRPDFRSLFAADVRETFLGGTAGAARDLSLYARPWDFALAAVTQRVHLWHGEADRVLPVLQARYLARTLPDCAPTYVPDAGHFWFADHMDQVLDAVVRPVA